MPSADISPREPELPAELQRIELSALEHDHAVADVELAGAALADQRAGGVSLQCVRLTYVDLSSFAYSQLTRVTLEDCVLSQTDFLDARLDGVRFHDCDLTRADFRGARLKRCELRRNDLSELEGVESLRGAALEWGDIVAMAGLWAGALGIDVLDAE